MHCLPSLDQIGDVKDRLARLRAIGFQIAIDDLGAGYAGLSWLADLRPDVVKLDMSLTRDVNSEPTKQKLIGQVHVLCKDLGMQVITEGVETIEELHTLTDLGCALFQGYLFAKPGQAFPQVNWPQNEVTR